MKRFLSGAVLSLLALPALAVTVLSERENPLNTSWQFSRDQANWQEVAVPHDFSITGPFGYGAGYEAESGYLPGGTGYYRRKFTVSAAKAGSRILLEFDAVYQHATVKVNGTEVGQNHYGYNNFFLDVTDQTVCDGVTRNILEVKVEAKVPSSRWYSGAGIESDVKLHILPAVHIVRDGAFITAPGLKTDPSSGLTRAAVEVKNASAGVASVKTRVSVCAVGSLDALATATSAAFSVGAGATVTNTVDVTYAGRTLWSPSNPQRYQAKIELLDADDAVLDTQYEIFGYCWSERVSGVGLKWNGANLKLFGVDLHHDLGAAGAAFNEGLWEKRLLQLKDMGVNGIRLGHNPYPKRFIGLCGKLGILVLDEFFDGWYSAKNGNGEDFSNYFENEKSPGYTWAHYVVDQVVRRDRNSPAILCWDIGNEIQEGSGLQGNSEKAGTTAANLCAWVAANDPTRPPTIGDNTYGLNATVAAAITAAGGWMGGNYAKKTGGDYGVGMISQYGPILETESCSAVNGRGSYKYCSGTYDNDQKYRVSSYDMPVVSWGCLARQGIQFALANDNVMGQFVWTGFDYIGEPTPWNSSNTSVAPGSGGVAGQQKFPNSSYFGRIDTCGFEKDTYYLYRSQWKRDGHTLHLVGGWTANNQYMDGGKAVIWLYTDAPKFQLLLNGTVIAEGETSAVVSTAGYSYLTVSATAKTADCVVISGSGYETLGARFKITMNGVLTAKAFDAQDHEITSGLVGRTRLAAPDSSKSIHVTADAPSSVAANSDNIVRFVIDIKDSAGQLDLENETELSVALSGNGEIVGVDNGNPASLKKYQVSDALAADRQSATIDAHAGKALVLVRATDAGQVSLNVTGSGLTAGNAGFTATAKTEVLDPWPDEVAYLRNVSTAVLTGGTPTLPSAVMGLSDTGLEVAEIPVTWDAVSSSDFMTVDAVVTVNGHATADANLTVKAFVRVAETIGSGGTECASAGIAPTCPNRDGGFHNYATSNALIKLTDNDRTTKGWDDWTQYSGGIYSNETYTLTFDLGSAKTIRSFTVWHHDEGQKPAAYAAISTSADGSAWTVPLKLTPAQETGLQYDYTLPSDRINVRYVRILLGENSDGTESLANSMLYHVIDEIEIFAVVGGGLGTTSGLESILVDGAAIEDFSGDVYSYEVAGGVLVSGATGSGNVAVTVLPVNAVNDTAYVVTLSEDGQSSQRYMVKMTNPCAHEHTSILNAVAPTCTETGLTQGVHCNDCNKDITPQQIVNATGHTVVDNPNQPASIATEEHEGHTQGTWCSVCHAIIYASETIPQLVPAGATFMLRNIAAVTVAGTAADLPATVKGLDATGEITGDIPVVWTTNAATYASAGTVEVTGSATVGGQPMSVTAFVRIVPAGGVEENHASTATCTVEGLNTTHITESKISDMVAPAENANMWGNPADMIVQSDTVNKEFKITAGWTSAKTISKVEICYLNSNWSMTPDLVEFYSNADCQSQNKIAYDAAHFNRFVLTNKPNETNYWYTYTFDEPQTVSTLVGRFKNTDSKTVVVRLWPIGGGAPDTTPKTNDQLATLTTSGATLAGFAPSTYDYTVTNATAIATAKATVNTGITILPLNSDTTNAYAVTVSESGTASRKYSVYMPEAEEPEPPVGPTAFMLRNIAAVTTEGVAPTLPDQVWGLTATGETNELIGVTWNMPSANSFTVAASPVTVTGTATVDEVEKTVYASVRVGQGGGGADLENIARDRIADGQVTKDITGWNYKADYLYKATKPTDTSWNELGIRRPQNKDRTYACRFYLTWDAEKTISKVTMYYDKWYALPYTVKFYSNAACDQEISTGFQTSDPELDGNYKKIDYTFSSPIHVTTLGCMVDTEAEIPSGNSSEIYVDRFWPMSPVGGGSGGSVTPFDSDTIAAMTVTGGTLDNFSPTTYIYTVSNATAIATATAAVDDNVGVTILPLNASTTNAYAVTVSEDGAHTQKYSVYMPTEVICPHLHTTTNAGYAATCTVDGLTDMIVCDDCHVTLQTAEPINAPGHQWGDWHETTAPTPEQDGVESRECTVCQEPESRPIPKLPDVRILRNVAAVMAEGGDPIAALTNKVAGLGATGEILAWYDVEWNTNGLAFAKDTTVSVPGTATVNSQVMNVTGSVRTEQGGGDSPELVNLAQCASFFNIVWKDNESVFVGQDGGQQLSSCTNGIGTVGNWVTEEGVLYCKQGYTNLQVRFSWPRQVTITRVDLICEGKGFPEVMTVKNSADSLLASASESVLGDPKVYNCYHLIADLPSGTVLDSLKIDLDTDANRRAWIAEIRVFGYDGGSGGSVTPLSNDQLSALVTSPVTLENFVASTYSYTVEGATAITDANASENTGITILPLYAGTTNAYVVTVSEDGAHTQKYSVYMPEGCKHEGDPIVHPMVPATCLVDGTNEWTECASCHAVITAPTVIPATGHGDFYYDGAVPATCEIAGSTGIKKCGHCHAEIAASEPIAALGHLWDAGTVTKEATETEEGERTYHCTRTNCEETKTVAIPKVVHTVALRNVATVMAADAQGTASLPAQVWGLNSVGETNALYDVTWTDNTAGRFATTNTIVVVDGTAVVDSEIMHVKASVRVELGEAPIENMALGVVPTCDNRGGNGGNYKNATKQATLVDGVTTHPGNDREWNTWNQYPGNLYSNETYILHFDLGEAKTLSSLRIWLDAYVRKNINFIEIKVSENGSDWETVQYSRTNSGALTGNIQYYDLAFASDRENVRYVDLSVGRLEGGVESPAAYGDGYDYIVLYEVEIFGKGTGGNVDPLSAKDLSAIKVDGAAVTGFAPMTYVYEVEDGKAITAATAAENMGITILPKNAATTNAYVVTVAEDGVATAKYSVYMPPSCEHNAVLVDIPTDFPTCTTPGHHGGKRCPLCEQVAVDWIEDEPLGHNLVTNIAYIAPTYETDGRTAEIGCTRCDYIEQCSEVIPHLVPTIALRNEAYVIQATAAALPVGGLGTALPEYVWGLGANGTTSALYQVTWSDNTAGRFNAAGTVVVNGTAEVNGGTKNVTASVRVVTSTEAPNLSATANECNITGPGVGSHSDAKITNVVDHINNIWGDPADMISQVAKAQDAFVKLGWNSEQTVSSVKVCYCVATNNYWASVPDIVEFYSTADHSGAPIPVADATGPTGKAQCGNMQFGYWYEYTFATPQTLSTLVGRFYNTDHQTVLVRFWAMGDNPASAKANAKLNDLEVDGADVEGFSPNVYQYEKGDALAITAATAPENTGITILPRYEQTTNAYVVTVAEDGIHTALYSVYMPEICKHPVTNVYERLAPTCTTDGHEYWEECNVCKHELVAKVVLQKLGHDEEVTGAVAPTCTEPGNSGSKVCHRCYQKLSDASVLPALGHSWDGGEVVKWPTTEQEGTMLYTCTREGCGATKTEPIEKLLPVNYLRNVSAVTTPNQRPSLTNYVAGLTAVGEASGLYPVTWDAADLEDSRFTNGYVTVHGTARVENEDLPVTASVRVYGGVPFQHCVTADGMPTSVKEPGKFGLSKLTDGDFATEAWGNWVGNNQLGVYSNVTHTLVFPVTNLNEVVRSVRIWFVQTYQCQRPAAYLVVRGSVDGSSWTDIPLVDAEPVEGEKIGSYYPYTYTFAAPQTGFWKYSITLSVRADGSERLCTKDDYEYFKLSEVEFIGDSTDGSSEPMGSPALSSLAINGKTLSGFTAEGWNRLYQFECPSPVAETNLFVESALKNAGITVLPIRDEDNTQYIVTLAEDGSTQWVWRVLFCPHPSTRNYGGHEAGCTHVGDTGTEVCERCGQLVKPTEPIPALGHDFDWSAGNWVTNKAPTEAEMGERSRECQRCHAVIVETVAALPGNVPALLGEESADEGDAYRITGIIQDYREPHFYVPEQFGFVIYQKAALGERNLTVNTPGRTKVTFDPRNVTVSTRHNDKDGLDHVCADYVYHLRKFVAVDVFAVRPWMVYTDNLGIKRYGYGDVFYLGEDD